MSLAQLASRMTTYPQVLVNVKVSRKTPFDQIPAVKEAMERLEQDLQGSGRLLVRYSGTENLARIMIEGKDHAEIQSRANQLADLIRAEIGA
jgi:phosphoglucosamine mutase